MDLILWRHADAHEVSEEGPDLDRSLTSKGERQAARIAGWLNQQLPAPARVLVSTAWRHKIRSIVDSIPLFSRNGRPAPAAR